MENKKNKRQIGLNKSYFFIKYSDNLDKVYPNYIPIIQIGFVQIISRQFR
jgi:hypothetical protein